MIGYFITNACYSNVTKGASQICFFFHLESGGKTPVEQLVQEHKCRVGWSGQASLHHQIMVFLERSDCRAQCPSCQVEKHKDPTGIMTQNGAFLEGNVHLVKMQVPVQQVWVGLDSLFLTSSQVMLVHRHTFNSKDLKNGSFLHMVHKALHMVYEFHLKCS